MTAKSSTAPIRLSTEAVIPLRTVDPTAPLDDLAWLDAAIGDARVVAIGESAHYNREFYQLRHRLLRYLVERHGFSAYTMESGFPEGWLIDAWVRSGGGSADDEHQLSRAMASGTTSLMGLWTEMRAQLEWMRRHNLTASPPVGFYGLDLPGSSLSLLPGLDAVIAYLAEADPEYQLDPRIRETASSWAVASSFSAANAMSGYANLEPERKDGLTAGLADLAARLTAQRLDYVRRTSIGAYERARHSLSLTLTLDAMAREVSRGNPQGILFNLRDAAMASTVEWILRREDRIVVAAHNGHIQRYPASLPGMSPESTTTLGMHLADRLDKEYLVIGTTTSTGQTLSSGADFYTGKLFQNLEPPQPGSLNALMDASYSGPFVTDLRRLSPADTRTIQTVSRQGIGNIYCDVKPLDAFDLIVHIPHVSPAEPDRAALAYAPQDVQEPFSGYKPA